MSPILPVLPPQDDSPRLEPDLEAIALTPLMEGAERVDSTAGVQMAFLEKWAARAHPRRLAALIGKYV